MTSMVERIARIIDPDAFTRHAELHDRLTAAWATPEVAKEMADKEIGDEVDTARSKALAVLREMREPTEVMYRGASEDGLVPPMDAQACFRAAIDAEIAAYEADRASPVLRPPS